MRKFILIFFIFNIFCILYADEFEVKSFKEITNDLSARTYQRKDVNDEICAIIKVRTDLEGLLFETNLGIEGDIVEKTGELWIYVSPGEKQIRISKEGFIILPYNIPITIQSRMVYIMELTRVEQKGTLIIKAIESDIYIDGKRVGYDYYKSEMPATKYKLKAIKEKHTDDEKEITLSDNEEKRIVLNPEPQLAYLKIEVEPEKAEKAEIYTNGEIQKNRAPTELFLLYGKYDVTLKHPSFLEITKSVNLKENESKTLKFVLQSNFEAKANFWKWQKRIGLASGVIIAGCGYYCNDIGDGYYDDYRNSTSVNSAIEARDNTEKYYQYRDYSYYISVAPIIYSGYCWIKEIQYNKKMK